jgi:hypothetical protein
MTPNLEYYQLTSMKELRQSYLAKSGSQYHQVNGAVPITHQQVEAMLRTFGENLSTHISQSVNRAAREETLNEIETINNVESFGLYNWGGKFHLIPEGFRFPSKNVNLKVIRDLWWFGNQNLRIPPYRNIGKDLDNNDKSAYSKAKFVIHHLEVIYLNFRNSDRNLSNLSMKELDDAFKVVYPLFIKQIYPNKVQEQFDLLHKSDCSNITLYDLAKKALI